MTYVVFDIGGTKTRVAISDDLKTLRDLRSFPTKKTFKDGVATVIKTIEAMVPKGEVEAIAGGIRGLLSEDKSGIQNDAVLGAWADQSLTKALEKHFGVSVYLENDTAMAGLGEAVFGAGQGMDLVVYHTISTGVGGVKIEHGVIDEASSGFEPGHQVLDIDRTILGDEISPTLENLVSGAGLEARLGVKAYEIPQEDLVWDELAEYLAQGLRNTILYWSPEVIVLGGSMINGDPKIQIEAIRKYTVEVLDGFVTCPFITTATLKDEAGLYGAMVYLTQRNAGK
jgi:predicted NBD/HSP70 family sugar kinase